MGNEKRQPRVRVSSVRTKGAASTSTALLLPTSSRVRYRCRLGASANAGRVPASAPAYARSVSRSHAAVRQACARVPEGASTRGLLRCRNGRCASTGQTPAFRTSCDVRRRASVPILFLHRCEPPPVRVPALRPQGTTSSPLSAFHAARRTVQHAAPTPAPSVRRCRQPGVDARRSGSPSGAEDRFRRPGRSRTDTGVTSCSPETQSRQGTVPSSTNAVRHWSQYRGSLRPCQGLLIHNPSTRYSHLHQHMKGVVCHRSRRARAKWKWSKKPDPGRVELLDAHLPCD